MSQLFSLYLHIPFCHHKCSYCDFNTYTGLESLIGSYVEAFRKEAGSLASAAGSRLPVHTVYFGGGTPSLLPLSELERILTTLETAFDLQPGRETTLEANPGTVSLDSLGGMHTLGINRLSLGMQSAHPGDLGLLEREHGYKDVVQAVVWAQRAGYENLNLDLIYGIPGQDLARWQMTLNLAMDLQPDHLSLYSLSLEHGTPLQHWVNRGLLQAPDPDLAADMIEWASEALFSRGYIQYEISNWARSGESGALRACQHNLQYWRNLPYLGLGAGAHGYVAGLRTANVLSPATYIQRCQDGSIRRFPLTCATQDAISIDPHTEMQETMLMGLRLTEEGVSKLAFERRFGSRLEQIFAREVQALLEEGLLEWAGESSDILRLSPRGRMLGNRVFVQFV